MERVAIAVSLCVAFATSVPRAAAGVIPAPGFVVKPVASGSWNVVGLEYNPVTDTFLGIDTRGFDYITEAPRGGTIRVIADTFGLGGLSHDTLAVTGANFAYVAEPHGRYVYKLNPATLGAVKTLLGSAPGYPGSPEHVVVEAMPDGLLLAGFGPVGSSAPPDAPRNWFYVAPGGPPGEFHQSRAMKTNNSIIWWLSHDTVTDSLYGIDLYDPTNSGEQPYWNSKRGWLVTLDTSTSPWQVNKIRQYIGISLYDLEPDRSHDLVPSDVLWTGRSTTENYDGPTEIVAIDPLTGDILSTLATATDGWLFQGVALAPSSDDPNRMSLYASLAIPGGEFQVVELTIPEPATVVLLVLGCVGVLAASRCARK